MNPANRPLLPGLSAVALLLFTLLIALPFTFYVSNPQGFSLTLPQLLLFVSVAFLAAIAAYASLARFLPALRHERLVALLLGLALLVWLQGNVLVWQYGPLDGRTINWAANDSKGWLDLGVWIAVAIVALWKARALVSAATFIASVLIVLQMLGMFFAHAKAPVERVEGTIKSVKIETDKKFAVASGRNVFVILVDEVQSDVVAEILESEPEYAKMLDGFTYFPDAVAGASYTELAVPAMLTGKLYDNSVPKADYLSEAYRSHSLFAMFKRKGFRVDVFPWVGWANETILFDHEIADNLVKESGSPASSSAFLTEQAAKEVVHLWDLALFRAVPHFVKPFIYNDQEWFLMGVITRLVPDDIKAAVASEGNGDVEAVTFAKHAQESLRQTLSGDAFKYYHLRGGHNPLRALPDLSLSEKTIPFSRDAYKLQIKQNLKALGVFFDTLRKTGVYERSMILVISDHGSGLTDEMYVRSTKASVPRLASSVAKAEGRVFARDKARGIPLVMIKRFDSSGPLETSATPVSAMDVPATFASEMGFDETVDGRSMFADPAVDRVRHHAAFGYSASKTSYVGPIFLYAVRGNSWDDSSWELSQLLLPPVGGDGKTGER